MATVGKFLMKHWMLDGLVPITYDDANILAALPSTLLRDPDPAKPVRTTGTTFEAVFDLSGVEQPYGPLGLLIGNHNLSPTAVIKFQLNASNSWGSPSVDVTLDLSALSDDTNYLSTDQLFNEFILLLKNGVTETFSYDWMRIEITDDDNPDTYIQIGTMDVGPIGGEENFTWGPVKGATSTEQIIEMSAGATQARGGKVARMINLSFRNVELEMLTRVRRWIEDGGFARERWIALRAEDDDAAIRTYYGRIEDISELNQVIKNDECEYYSFNMRFLDLCPPHRNLGQSKYETHAEFVALKKRTDVFLTLVVPGEIVTGFALDSGAMYKVDFPTNASEYWQAVQVWVDGVKQTRVGSTGSCASTAGSWFFNIESERVLYLHLDDGGDPADHEVEVRFLMGFCTEIPEGQKALVMDVTFDGATISNVLFEKRLSKSGLSSIGSRLPSAYYGLAIPDLSGISIINEKQRYSDQNGRMDKFVERFVWKQRYAYVYHGDGGAVLSFDEHLFIDSFQITGLTCDHDIFTLKFSSAALLDKTVPDEVFANDEAFRQDYKPHYWGTVDKMPTYRQNNVDFGFAGHATDDLIAVTKGENDPLTATLNSSATESSITIESAPSKEDGKSVAVKARRAVDVDLATADTQYAGAFIRSMLYELGHEDEDALPTTSFQTMDTLYGYQARAWIGGGKSTLRQELEKAARSFFCWIRKASGIWEVYHYDVNHLRDSVATINDNDILGTPRIEMLEEAVVRRIRVPYFEDLALKESKYVTTNLGTDLRYPRTEIFELEETFCAEEDDAALTRDCLAQIYTAPRMRVYAQATGAIFLANAGDIITFNYAKGFNTSGAWVEEQFIVVEILKHCDDQPGPGFCDLVLEKPSSGAVSNTSVLFAGHRTWKEVSETSTASVVEISRDKTHNGGAIEISIHYSVGATPCLPDVVTWNGDACTLVDDTSAVDSNDVRVAVYVLFAADTGTHTAYAHFPNAVDNVTLNVKSLTNATAVRDSAVAYSASGLSISATVTSAVGDMVISSYMGKVANDLDEHRIGDGQLSHCAQRMSFNGSYTNANSGDAHGTHKNGATSSTTMRHREISNAGAKSLVVVSYQA